MTDFTPQSTDRSNDNTNPNVTNVVLEGSVVIDVATSGSYFEGTVDVTFPIDTVYSNLDVEAWIRVQTSGGANPVAYYKMPFTDITNAGVVAKCAFIYVTQPTKSGIY